MKAFEKGVHDFTDHTTLGIQTLIAEARSSEGSSISRPNQERDRPVFGPRDYTLDVIRSQMSLDVWKTWRHEVEIYVDSIGPSWRTVKLVLQQARHSAIPLMPTVPSMDVVFQKAKKANNGVEPFNPATVDYVTKAVSLYRILIPKLTLDLSTEFRNSASDNGFELWQFFNRKLD